MEHRGLVLGLDLGPNSVGWALVDASFDGPGQQVAEHGIVDAGVRVFDEGLAAYGSRKERSRSVERRAARSARRVLERRNRRRKALRAILQAGGLLPQDPAGLQEWIGPYAHGARPRDPYELRARALDESLQPHEFGVALYHLSQRRGFKSNRKETRDSKEAGLIAERVKSLSDAMADAGARTLGEYLWKLRRGDARALAAEEVHCGAYVRVRNRHTSRAMYLDEFERIWTAQQDHHPALLTSRLKSQISETVFFQRPYEVTQDRLDKLHKRPDGKPVFANLSRSPSVGRCPLEPGERRLWRGHWLAQRFRVLKEVNNLRVRSTYEYGRALSAEERAAVLADLHDRSDRTFDQLRKAVSKVQPDLGDATFHFNLEAGSRKKLLGNTVEAALRGAYGTSAWRALPEARKMALRLGVSDLEWEEEDPDRHAQRMAELVNEDGLPAEGRQRLLKLRAADGYLAFSRMAVEKLLPYLEQGLHEHDAIQRAYPDRAAPCVLERLPLPDRAITNPVVRRALTETRKVVNAILRTYGRPTRVVVEMARDMAQSSQQRREASYEMRKREAQRDQVKSLLAEHGLKDASAVDVLTYELALEQGWLCPYSGKTIALSQVLDRSGEVQIDHILPRWRSGDDSRSNKVLCYADANRRKGDRTPYEWLGADGKAWGLLLARIEAMRDMPNAKKRRFVLRELAEDEFIQRNLNDTRYISRQITEYLNRLYPSELRVGEKAVATTRGFATYELRRLWGLDGMLPPLRSGEKTLGKREDHRHHAVDALVVALTNRRHLQALSRVYKEAQVRGGVITMDREAHRLAPPWQGLRDEALRVMEGVNVSHRVDRKVRGALHEATYMGATSEACTFVTRKRLEDLSRTEVLEIRDDSIRQLVVQHLQRRGWDGGAELPKDAFLGESNVVRMPSGVPVRRVRLLRKATQTVPLGCQGKPPHRHAQLGNNHHVEIVELCGSDGHTQLRATVVPMVDYARQVRQGGVARASIPRTDGHRVRMTLARSESVMATHPETGQRTLCVVLRISFSGAPTLSTGIDLYLLDARDARPASDAAASPFARVSSMKRFGTLNLEKVTVDPLGRVHRTND